ncbi:hypothetical protein [Pseudophaeobacter sp.]|uniref:hypothetical protein n=1 Tax=Pseudophaeobacter sp. TaxID=1971739 RepID=UPI00262BD586|nr:hypothetical protein [Pseudophaeobacter sp.]
MTDESQKKGIPFIYRAFTWTAAGSAAVWGVLVTVSDPQTLDNVMTLPKRFSSYFEENRNGLIDETATRILLQGYIRQSLDNTVKIPANSKDELSAHLAEQCLEKFSDLEKAANETPSIREEEVATESTFDEYSPSFDQMTNNGISSTVNLPSAIGYCSYITGFTVGALGAPGLAQYVENPRQIPMKNPLAKLGFGRANIQLPSMNDAIHTE